MLLVTCGLAFLAAVPLVLLLRALRPQRVPWWLVIVMCAILGWCIRNIHSYVETQAIHSWQAEHPYAFIEYWRATDPLRELRWGWAEGLAYLALCLGPYWVLRTVINRPPNNRWRGP